MLLLFTGASERKYFKYAILSAHSTASVYIKPTHSYKQSKKTNQRGFYSCSAGGETFRADEAPADIDVLMVLAAFAGDEMVWTQEAVVGQRNTASSHAVVICMVSHWTTHTAGQTTYNKHRHTHQTKAIFIQ